MNGHQLPVVPSHAIFQLSPNATPLYPPGQFIAIDEEFYGPGRADAPMPFEGFAQMGTAIRPYSVSNAPSEFVLQADGAFGNHQDYMSYLYRARPMNPGGGTDAAHIGFQ